MTKHFKSLALSFAILATLATPAKADDIFKYHPTYEEGFFMQPYIGASYTLTSADLGTSSGIAYSDVYESNYNNINPFVGARIHKNLGVELGYMESGSKRKSGDFTATAGFAGSTDTKIKAYTLDVMGYYQMPNNKTLELIGLIGLGRYKVNSDIAITSGSASASFKANEDMTGIRTGLGAQYFISDNVKVRGLAKYIHVDSDVIDSSMEYSLGMAYRF